MTKTEIAQALNSKNTGWMVDRWGNYTAKVTHYLVTKKFVHKETGAIRLIEAQKDTDGSIYRIKIQAKSLRFEKKVVICEKNEWLKIASGYMKDIDLVEVDEKKYIVIGSIKIPVSF